MIESVNVPAGKHVERVLHEPMTHPRHQRNRGGDHRDDFRNEGERLLLNLRERLQEAK